MASKSDGVGRIIMYQLGLINIGLLYQLKRIVSRVFYLEYFK